MGFVMEYGPRDPGPLNWLKYRPHGTARPLLFFWRMFWSTYDISRWEGQEPMSRWECLRYAVQQTHQIYYE